MHAELENSAKGNLETDTPLRMHALDYIQRSCLLNTTIKQDEVNNTLEVFFQSL